MWLSLLGLAACDCSTRGDAFEPPDLDPDPKGTQWEQIGRAVGEEVPTPGPPPDFRPLKNRRTESLAASPRVLAEADYASIALGEPKLAVRTAPPSTSRATIVALEADGPRDLASVGSRFVEIAADGEHVYCASADGLQRIAIGDGTSTTIARDAAKTMALSDTHVYWVTGGGAVLGDPPSALHRARKDGTEVETLYRDLPYIHEIAPQGERIHWVAKMRPRRKMDMPPGYYATAPAEGSAEPTVQTFESQRPTELAVDDEAVYVVTEGTLGGSIEGSFNDGLVLRRDHGQERWDTLADRQSMPSSLVQDEAHLCWHAFEGEDYAIRCVAKKGGPALNVAGVSMLPPRLALRDGLLAWTDPNEERAMIVELPEP